ncbi:MAG: hypothetical protein MI923_21490 [Phycisphaerales bacterium]|nr:hypothetical protein [Phycisphaerales bacterium]
MQCHGDNAALKHHQSANRWHNHLPAWITQHAEYQRLRQPFRQTLQGIANSCDVPHSDGSLIGAFGGERLLRACGCSRSAFWRHLTKLERLGFVVTLGRGGTYGSRNYGNQYGIPGQYGALDNRRCRREMRRMIRGRDGILRPEVIAPGDQVTIWPNAPNHSPSHFDVKSGTGVVSKWDGGRVKVRRGSSQSGTPPSPIPSPHGSMKSMGDGACSGQSRRRPRIRHFSIEDLTDTDRLLELYADSVRRELVEDSQAGRLKFVAMAEHALHWGKAIDKCRVFAGNVNNGRWLLITQADEDLANRRLKQHFHGEDRESEGGGHQAAQRVELSQADKDAKLVNWIAKKLGREPMLGDPGVAEFLKRETGAEWSVERFRDAKRRCGF